MGASVSKAIFGRELRNGELELNTVRGILVIQACIVAYYVITIALAFVRAIMGWNPKKGARKVRLILEKWEAPEEDEEYDECEESDERKEIAVLPSHLKMN